VSVRAPPDARMLFSPHSRSGGELEALASAGTPYSCAGNSSYLSASKLNLRLGGFQEDGTATHCASGSCSSGTADLTPHSTGACASQSLQSPNIITGPRAGGEAMSGAWRSDSARQGMRSDFSAGSAFSIGLLQPVSASIPAAQLSYVAAGSSLATELEAASNVHHGADSNMHDQVHGCAQGTAVLEHVCELSSR
jgi:hypothetical protein